MAAAVILIIDSYLSMSISTNDSLLDRFQNTEFVCRQILNVCTVQCLLDDTVLDYISECSSTKLQFKLDIFTL